MVENKNAKTPADNGKPVAWITRGKLTMIRADAVMLDDTSIPLYVAPRKQWVGLTDEERRQILLDDPIDWIVAIEAKLREKNT